MQVIDDVLPWLLQIPFKEPDVIMAIVGIFKLAFTNSKLGLTKEVMANKILPFLIPLSIENGLTVQHFNSISSIIRDMLDRVETEHRTKLEHLNAVQDSQKPTLKVGLSESLTLPPGQLVAAPTAQEVSSMDSMIDELGLGNYVNRDKSKLVNQMIGDKNNQTKNEINIPKSTSSASLQERQRILAEEESAQNRPANKSPPTPCRSMDLTNDYQDPIDVDTDSGECHKKKNCKRLQNENELKRPPSKKARYLLQKLNHVKKRVCSICKGYKVSRMG